MSENNDLLSQVDRGFSEQDYEISQMIQRLYGMMTSYSDLPPDAKVHQMNMFRSQLMELNKSCMVRGCLTSLLMIDDSIDSYRKTIYDMFRDKEIPYYEYNTSRQVFDGLKEITEATRKNILEAHNEVPD